MQGRGLTLKEQQDPYPLAQEPMFMPALREHSASDRQVPDSSWSLWQAVFWLLRILSMAATEFGRNWALTGAIMASPQTANNKRVALYILLPVINSLSSSNGLQIIFSSNSAAQRMTNDYWGWIWKFWGRIRCAVVGWTDLKLDWMEALFCVQY